MNLPPKRSVFFGHAQLFVNDFCDLPPDRHFKCRLAPWGKGKETSGPHQQCKPTTLADMPKGSEVVSDCLAFLLDPRE